MNSYYIKINGKYLKKIIDTNIQQIFRGQWNNHTKQSCSNFILCDKNNAKIIEGNINLKSYIDVLIGVLKDGYFKINKIEVIKI